MLKSRKITRSAKISNWLNKNHLQNLSLKKYNTVFPEKCLQMKAIMKVVTKTEIILKISIRAKDQNVVVRSAPY